MSDLLVIQDLKVGFKNNNKIFYAVDGINLVIKKNQIYALLGESGSGKTVTALTICQLLIDTQLAHLSGKILFNNQNLLEQPEHIIQNIRGKKIGFIFQEPMSALNPVLTVAEQINEIIKNPKTIIDLLLAVGLQNPRHCLKQYPHELSGGMRQRVMIAMAIAGEPDLLIADEPTTALDVTTQVQILDLIKSLQQKYQMAVLFITHDLSIVSNIADKVGVMYAGQIVEEATPEVLFKNPGHPYTMQLLESLPNFEKRGSTLRLSNNGVVIRTGCRFINFCNYSDKNCHKIDNVELRTISKNHKLRCLQSIKPQITPNKSYKQTINNETNILEIKNLSVEFPIRQSLFWNKTTTIKAVNNVSLTLKSGKICALVGESGCGKSTLAKTLVGLNDNFNGDILYQNQLMNLQKKSDLKFWHSQVQIIFQDPYSAINPRMMIKDVVAEGAIALKVWQDNIDDRVIELLQQVGLSGDILQKYPHEFSGGQRQRIVIARALAIQPKILICDEPTSALDVSVQAQVLNLLKDLQHNMGLSYLFITHDLQVVAWLADKISVMYLGKIVESGTTEEILKTPKHPYTQLLMNTLSTNERTKVTTHIVNKWADNIKYQGCLFRARCPSAMDICKIREPSMIKINDTHEYACHNI